MRVLVIGATGYVGSRLVPLLLAQGHEVRCLVRDAAKLGRHHWATAVQVRPGDAGCARDVAAACGGVEVVFHLVHSMSAPDFAERDRHVATVLADAAHRAGVGRIIYLSGLQPAGDAVSAHLRSRREVGEVLLAGTTPTAVLQAGIVVGAGSVGFELIRRVAMAGPVLLMPDRAWNAVQPIGIDDALHHLAGCVRLPAGVDRAFDIGGPDVLSYRELVVGYAVATGLVRPLAVPVPLAMPRLTARLVAALTPVDRHLAGPLLESSAHDLVCRPCDIAELAALIGAPPGGPTPYGEAVRRVLAREGAAGRGPTDMPGPAGLLDPPGGAPLNPPPTRAPRRSAGTNG